MHRKRKDKLKLEADTLIVGDSMVRPIQPKKLSTIKRVLCKTIPGAKIDDVCERTKELAIKHNVHELILHVGTNYIATDEPEMIQTKLESRLWPEDLFAESTLNGSTKQTNGSMLWHLDEDGDLLTMTTLIGRHISAMTDYILTILVS